MTSRRRKFERHHALAAEGVRAYINDEDADLHNITNEALAEDALGAAWNLTALAAAAVEALGECRGIPAEQALDELVAKGYGGLSRAPSRRSVLHRRP